jgi:TP901 family phage tail tape measure protein|nr:MAG TPA: tail tape measure [Caudoviricetes sp.]
MAGVDDLGFKISVDASGATKGANEFTAAAGRIAEATRAMARATQGAKAAVLQNAVSGRGGAEYRTMMKQVEAYKGLIKVTRELAAARKELDGVDFSKTAQNISEAVKAMAKATRTTDYIGSPQLDKVKSQIDLYARLANVSRDLARANKELQSSLIKTNQAVAAQPKQKTELDEAAKREALSAFRGKMYRARVRQADPTASGAEVAEGVRAETQAYRELVDAIGKAEAAEEKRATVAGINQDLARARREEADETRRLAEAEREAAEISGRSQAFRATQIADINSAIDANNRYIGALESTRFAAQDLRNYLTLLAAGFTSLSVASVAAAASQERAFADVARTTQLSAQSAEMRALSNTYKDLSTQISTTYEDLSQIGSLGAQMGISADKLGDFTHAVAGFTTITGTNIDSATEAFGRFFEMVDNAGVEADHSGQRYMNFASQVAELGAKSVATESEILTMANSIAASAASAGIGQDAILAYATALSSLGIKQEWARGSLQRIFGSINDAVAEAGEGLDKFATVLGMTTTEAENLWRTDPSTFFNNLLTSLNNVTDSVERWTIIKNLGFKNTRDIQLLQRLSLNIDLVNESFRNSADAARNTEFLDKSLETLNATLTETIQRWKNSLANLGASLGGPFLGVVKKILDGLIVIQDALAHIGDNAFGRVFLAASSGLVVFGSLVAISKVLQALVLNVAASYVSMKTNMVQAGLSGQMTWSNIYKLIKQANMALYENIGLMKTRTALERSDQAATSLGGLAAAGAAAKKDAEAIKAVGDAAGEAGKDLASVGTAAASSAAQTGLLAKAMGGLKGVMSGIASIGPMGWIGIAATAIPVAIQLYDEWANSAKRAAEAAEQARVENLQALGGGEALTKALIQDAKEAADGTQQTFGALELAVDGSAASTKDSADALYYWIDASGNLVQATKDQAAAMGYSTLAIGDHTAALIKDAIASSDAFKSLSANDFKTLTDQGFDWKEWSRQYATGGQDAANSYIDGFIQQLKDRKDEIYKANTYEARTYSGPYDYTGTPIRKYYSTQAGQQAEQDVQNLNNQIEALENLRTKLGDVSGAASDAVSSQTALDQVVQGLTGSTDDASDATGSLADATADAAEDAKTAGQAWDEYLQSLDAIVDAAFQFTNAEAGMYSALDELNQSLYDNGNSFDTFTEAGRSNLEALQNYLKATAQYAGRMAEEMGMSGVEAQEYIASYVQAAIQDLKDQGIDTTWIEAQMSNVVSSLDQTISGPTVDMSALNAGLQDAVTNANNAAALIQQILAGVGIRTSSRPGGGLNTGGKRLNKNALGSKGGLTTKQITAGMSIGAMGFTGGGGSVRGLANTMFQGNKQRYQFTPKESSSRGGGGGGGGGHRGGGGGGGGGRDYTPRSSSSRTRKEKTPEEIFEDFLSRLDKAMNQALNKFWQNQDAQDKYHAQLNSMRKTIEDANKSIKDLTDDIWDLNNTLSEKENDLANQRYFQSVAKKYGDTSRQRDIQVDIDKTTKEISDTKNSIADKEKEIAKTKEGMYALQGYTEAAINNRAALKALQSTMIDMINAYAASGASTEQLTAYAAQLKQEFIAQATQMGFNQGEVTTLSGAFDNLTRTIQAVPRVVDVDVSDNGTAAATGDRIRNMASNGGAGYSAPVTANAEIYKARTDLADLTRDATKKIRVEFNTVINPIQRVGGGMGVFRGRAHGGRVPGYGRGGSLGLGRHGNWDADDMLGITPVGGVIGVQSGEYVMPRTSVDKYGPGMMEAIRAGQYRPEVKVNNSPGLSGPITINPNQIHQLARAVSTVLNLDGRQVGAAVNNVNARSGRRGTY